MDSLNRGAVQELRYSSTQTAGLLAMELPVQCAFAIFLKVNASKHWEEASCFFLREGPPGDSFGQCARAPLTLKQLDAAAAARPMAAVASATVASRSCGRPGSSRGCPPHDHWEKTANLRSRATASQGETYQHRRLQRRRAPRYTVVPTGGKLGTSAQRESACSYSRPHLLFSSRGIAHGEVSLLAWRGELNRSSR